MAITSEIIGKLGGGGVETIPVAISVSGNGTREIFRHIEATAEKPKLISVTGVGTYPASSTKRPVIEIGGTEWPTQSGDTPYSAVQVITEPSDIVFIGQGSGSGTFTGTVYVAEM